MEFKGDILGFEAQCLREVRDGLGHVDRRDLSPFRDLLGVELEGRYPDTAVVVTYRYKASYNALDEDLQAPFTIWSDDSVFKVSDESGRWSDQGERDIFLWFIEPDYEGPPPSDS
jgi:hypothetical protein